MPTRFTGLELRLCPALLLTTNRDVTLPQILNEAAKAISSQHLNLLHIQRHVAENGCLSFVRGGWLDYSFEHWDYIESAYQVLGATLGNPFGDDDVRAVKLWWTESRLYLRNTQKSRNCVLGSSSLERGSGGDRSVRSTYTNTPSFSEVVGSSHVFPSPWKWTFLFYPIISVLLNYLPAVYAGCGYVLLGGGAIDASFPTIKIYRESFRCIMFKTTKSILFSTQVGHHLHHIYNFLFLSLGCLIYLSKSLVAWLCSAFCFLFVLYPLDFDDFASAISLTSLLDISVNNKFKTF